MNIPIFIVDAFTVKPFSGNPAAVCILENKKDGNWMQSVANEMNLSETAFLQPQKNGFNLRWFTPTTEVDLCGHATIASAHILYEYGFYEEEETIELYTRSGTLTSSYDRGLIELVMPKRKALPMEITEGIQNAFGIPLLKAANIGEEFLLVEVSSEELIRSLEPNFKSISALPFLEVCITARGESDKYDFISRFFAPRLGINEDPVTGSSHCVLGTYWQEITGKNQFLAYQASPRGGEVEVKVLDTSTLIGGRAITILRGDLVHN
jgi:PhzF family phenazine biosynthesis protein